MSAPRSKKTEHHIRQLKRMLCFKRGLAESSTDSVRRNAICADVGALEFAIKELESFYGAVEDPANPRNESSPNAL